MKSAATYDATRDRVEDYFDRTATRTWEALTSDVPVSRIRQTVRAGRDRMRAVMLSRMPADLTGLRILDAGCGPGMMTAELAARGADVVAADISPSLIEIARKRVPAQHHDRVRFVAGDMLAPELGAFDHVVAMDSLIYYDVSDIADALERLAARSTEGVIFTVAPRTAFLMTFFGLGKLFPRADRSPVMIPHDAAHLNRATSGAVTRVERITSGFYISECLEYRT